MGQAIKVNRRDGLFAATPPLEAMNLLLSLAVTCGIGFKEGNKNNWHKLDFIDIGRAYYHAPACREVCVKLPPGDAGGGMCGLLIKSLPGTRDAAQNWEDMYMEFMHELGFYSGKVTPCMFWHKSRDIRVNIHGDDFTVLAREEQLDWFRSEISNKLNVKVRGRIGPDITDAKSIIILNRIVTWTPSGIKYEADQRHGQIIFKQLAVEVGVKALLTPGFKQEYRHHGGGPGGIEL